MTNLELKIPPPIIGLFCALTIWLLGRYAPVLSFDFSGQKSFALVLFAVGILIDSLALLKFRQKQTTINPMKPNESTDLVTTGIYNFTRNPMYLGLLVILSAWSLYIGNLAAIVILILFIYYITKFQILPEETVMHEKFGNSFAEYKQRVRRWI